MKRPLLVGAFVFFSITLAIGAQIDEVKALLSDLNLKITEGVQRSKNVMVPMRDGVRLATDIYLPVTDNQPYPVIYIRTTYGGFEFKKVKEFVDNGYAVIVQHVRGRFFSEGEYQSPYWSARVDGFDTIDWIVSQPWANGKVGTFGCSYLGESQIILAAANHPNHIAMIASGAGGAIGKAKDSYGYFGVFENGVLNLASSMGWFTAEGAKYSKVTPRPDDYGERMRSYIDHLPVSEAAKKIAPYETGFDDMINHSLTDSWWDREGYIHPDDKFSVATLHINDWFDQTAHNTFRLAEHMRENALSPRAKAQHVLIAPGQHCAAGKLKAGNVRIGDMTFAYVDKDFMQLYIDWFDYWLKDKPRPLPPKFEYFLIHSGQWFTTNQWPPESTEKVRFFLLEDGRLARESEQRNSQTNDGTPYNEFLYDPLNPVPTLGGPICCTYHPDEKSGPIDQQPLNSRSDILRYTSEQVTQDIDVVGSAKVVLFVSTDAKDTDFTVKMIDQYPDGRSLILQDGVFRLRYRNGIHDPRHAEPGVIYQIEFELRPIAYRFQKGHKIEIHISSSNFPRLVRNLNTGGDEYSDPNVVKATNRVYLGGTTSSFVDFPIMSSSGSTSKKVGK